MPSPFQRFQRPPSSREPSIWDAYTGVYPENTTAWAAPTYQWWYPHPFGQEGYSPLEKLTNPEETQVSPSTAKPPIGPPAVQGAGGTSGFPGVTDRQTPALAGALGLLAHAGTQVGVEKGLEAGGLTQPPTTSTGVGGPFTSVAGAGGGPVPTSSAGGEIPQSQAAIAAGPALAGGQELPRLSTGQFTGDPVLDRLREGIFASGNVQTDPFAGVGAGGTASLEGPALMNTEFLGSGVGAGLAADSLSAGIGSGLSSIPGAIINASMMDDRTTTGAQRGGTAVGGIGGAGLGAGVGTKVFPGVGTALGAILGSLLGSKAGGFLGELGFGGKGTLVERQAREAALQSHLATGAINQMRNVAGGGFQIPDILNYLSSSDNLSNQGFAASPGSSNVWATMIRTLLEADPKKYGQRLVETFHPDILKGFESQVGSYQPYGWTSGEEGDRSVAPSNIPSGPRMVWDPVSGEWVPERRAIAESESPPAD